MTSYPHPHPNPSKPTFVLPAGACDAHCHVFGPAYKFPLSASRTYTPADAPKEKLIALHRLLGISRTVYVQSACHGFDNRAMLDAVASDPANSRGVALVPTYAEDRQIEILHEGGVRGVRYNFVDGASPAPDFNAIDRLIERIAPFAWHILIHVDAHLLPELKPWIRKLRAPYAIDHMGRLSAGHYGSVYFETLLDLLQADNAWIKISAIERGSATGPPYADMMPIAHALVAAAPDRTLWGTDWPHPVLKGAMPDDGRLVDLIEELVPDADLRKRVLVDNPARFYAF